MTPVIWLGMAANLPRYWDCTIIRELLSGEIWTPAGLPTFEHTADPERLERGCVFIVPGKEWKDRTAELNALIDRARPCIVFVVKDEACLFPWRKLNLDRCKLWVQNPDPLKHDGSERAFPVGWTPGTRRLMLNGATDDKPLDWFFSGQVTHSRRKACAKQLTTMQGGELIETKGFTQGIPVEEYLAKMASCKIAPCPGGVITPDSFRAWEALELGCIPLADLFGGRGGGEGYWHHLLRCEIPFPLIENWMEAPHLISELVDSWPHSANRVGAWWAGWKRQMAHNFMDDLRDVGATEENRPGDRITVLMPTSSIPSHPSTAIIEETLCSIRRRPELDGCEIIVMCDGLREQHKERKADYDEYIRALLVLCKNIPNCYPIVFDTPHHQSGMTKEALKHVRTPAILYVEHDAPLMGEIPFENLIDAVQGEADVVRLHHEVRVLDCHMLLMPDGRETKEVAGVPMVRCVQWSQRPHVANTGYYRQILEDHFANSRDPMFIEDRMHGVVETAWRRHGDAGWHQHRLWMFHPEEPIKRSTHLDGRAGEDKVPG